DYPIRGALLDMYLIMEAHRSNKTTGSLETPEYFCELIEKVEEESIFFAVGAGHMLGKREHLIVRLKKYGYKITRICTYEKLILKKFGCKKKKIMEACIKTKAVPKRKTK
ncbi:unnamed protein product, partial [Rotaria magnacalcarata]